MDRTLQDTLTSHLKSLGYRHIKFNPPDFHLADAYGKYKDIEVVFIYSDCSEDSISRISDLKKSLNGQKMIVILPSKKEYSNRDFKGFFDKLREKECYPDAAWHIK